jgi:hypothetical protein
MISCGFSSPASLSLITFLKYGDLHCGLPLSFTSGKVCLGDRAATTLPVGTLCCFLSSVQLRSPVLYVSERKPHPFEFRLQIHDRLQAALLLGEVIRFRSQPRPSANLQDAWKDMDVASSPIMTFVQPHPICGATEM